MPARHWDRYIFNTLPLPHTLLLTLLLTITLRIAVSFHFHYAGRPILTLCVVSSLLASISDTLAQMVETIRLRGKMAAKLKDLMPPVVATAGEIELDEKHILSPGGSPRWESERGEFGWRVERGIDFDFPRMIRFMGYGFFFAPISVGSPVLACLAVLSSFFFFSTCLTYLSLCAFLHEIHISLFLFRGVLSTEINFSTPGLVF